MTRTHFSSPFSIKCDHYQGVTQFFSFLLCPGPSDSSCWSWVNVKVRTVSTLRKRRASPSVFRNCWWLDVPRARPAQCRQALCRRCRTLSFPAQSAVNINKTLDCLVLAGLRAGTRKHLKCFHVSRLWYW